MNISHWNRLKFQRYFLFEKVATIFNEVKKNLRKTTVQNWEYKSRWSHYLSFPVYLTSDLIWSESIPESYKWFSNGMSADEHIHIIFESLGNGPVPWVVWRKPQITNLHILNGSGCTNDWKICWQTRSEESFCTWEILDCLDANWARPHAEIFCDILILWLSWFNGRKKLWMSLVSDYVDNIKF